MISLVAMFLEIDLPRPDLPVCLGRCPCGAFPLNRMQDHSTCAIARSSGSSSLDQCKAKIINQQKIKNNSFQRLENRKLNQISTGTLKISIWSLTPSCTVDRESFPLQWRSQGNLVCWSFRIPTTSEDADAASNLTVFRLTPALGDLEFFRLAPATPELVGGGGLGFALTLGCRFAESSGLGIAFCFGFRLFLGWEGWGGFWTSETPETPEPPPSSGTGTLAGTTGGAPDAGAEGASGCTRATSMWDFPTRLGTPGNQTHWAGQHQDQGQGASWNPNCGPNPPIHLCRSLHNNHIH